MSSIIQDRPNIDMGYLAKDNVHLNSCRKTLHFNNLRNLMDRLCNMSSSECLTVVKSNSHYTPHNCRSGWLIHCLKFVGSIYTGGNFVKYIAGKQYPEVYSPSGIQARTGHKKSASMQDKTDSYYYCRKHTYCYYWARTCTLACIVGTTHYLSSLNLEICSC